MKPILAFLVLTLVFFSTLRIASAHAVPLACLPRIGINVTTPPAELICQFNQPLQASSISLSVKNASGERVDKNDTHFYQNDNYTIVVSLDTAKMPQGIYTASWQVTDTLDFGTTNGTFQFGVNTVVPPTPTAVLPSLPAATVTPQPTDNPTTDLISRFLIAVGVLVLIVIGVMFWRLRGSGRDAPGNEDPSQNDELVK